MSKRAEAPGVWTDIIGWTNKVAKVRFTGRPKTMDKFWVDNIEAVGAIAQPVVTVLGFAFVYLQIRGASKSIQSQATSELYGLGMRLYEMMIANPDIRRYLYESAEPPTNELERARLLVACEMFCDFFEYVLSEGDMIGDDVRLVWVAMMQAMVERSPAIQAFIDERRSQYTGAFLIIFDGSRKPNPTARV